MSKGYFHVFHDPEDGFISGKAKDVARDMVVRGAFKPYGWLEILIWTGISMFLSVKLCDHFQVESGIVRIIIWPFLGILFYLASRGIFFLSAWITSKKNAGIRSFAIHSASISGLATAVCLRNPMIPDWMCLTGGSKAWNVKTADLS